MHSERMKLVVFLSTGAPSLRLRPPVITHYARPFSGPQAFCTALYRPPYPPACFHAMDAPILAPPHTKPHVSVAKLTRFYYVACLSTELASGARPLARTIAGVPLVLFRSNGRPAALVDRCPHRNV